MERKGGLGAVTLVIIATFFFLQWDSMAGRAAPDFTLDQAYGGRVDLSAYQGKAVLLVFWLTSCGICRHELPVLDRLSAEFRARAASRCWRSISGTSTAHANSWPPNTCA